MLMIRLQRVGRKHEPVFRLVLTDSKNGPKSGKFLEILGHFDARNSEKAVSDTEKVKGWMSKGAKLSDTVHNLLVERKVIEGKKINNLPKKRPLVSEKVATSATGSSEPKEEKEAPKASPAEKVESEKEEEVVAVETEVTGEKTVEPEPTAEVAEEVSA